MGSLAALTAALFLGTSALAFPLVVSAQSTTTQWRASLTAANEVPPTQSTATGTFTATLDETAGTLTWTLKVPPITGATMAHIHSGAAGTDGPIVVGLYTAGSAQGFDTIDTSGVARAIDVVGPLSGDFSDLVDAIKAGTAYVNVHTVANPAGAIRAQITSGTATPTATSTAAPTVVPTVAGTPAAVATLAPTVVAATAVPAAPKSGTGGYMGGSAVVTLSLAALAVVAAGTGLVASRSKSARHKSE